MTIFRLLQLLASFAALRIDAFSYRQIHTSKPTPTNFQYVRFESRRMSHRSDSNSDERDDTTRHDGSVSRRSLFHSAGLLFAGTVSSGPLASLGRFTYTDPNVANKKLGDVNAANAMGLVQFPCQPGELTNTYHMMRAGESGLEAEGILSTNPLFLTNREDALTDLGTMQVEEACNAMMLKDINPSVVKYSLAAKSIDSANIVATTMMVGRNRIVPEFTFMDPRGAGLWDGRPLAATEAAIWAMDVAKAGDEGRDGRPPAHDDGTANETLFDQVIRLRQLMSVLETQYSGDCILLIFPDGTSPALLSCLIAGIPLKDVHALNFIPGELRLEVDMVNARQLLEERITSPSYTDAISMGQDELLNIRKEEEQLKLLAIEESNKALKSMPSMPQQIESTPNAQKVTQRARNRATGNDGVTNLRHRATGDDGATNSDPDLFSAGAMGVMGSSALGYMTMLRAPEDESDGSETKSESPAPVLAYAGSTGAAPVRAHANSTGASVFEQQAPASSLATLEKPASVFEQQAPAPSLATLEKSASVFEQQVPASSLATLENNFRASTSTFQVTATNMVDANTGLTNSNVFEDVPVLSQQDRVEAAEKAMDEYLSQDDGGDGWLTSMRDIMDE